MSVTFACPHCGATYPRKPVLVGRAVRCTTCKNAFCLREDGIADKVENPVVPAAPAAVAPPAPKPAAPRPVEPPAAAPPKVMAKAPATKPTANRPLAEDLSIDLNTPGPQPIISDQPTPGAGRTASASSAAGRSSDRSDRLTTQQQEARRAMAATLATSMSAALKAESVKRETEAEQKEKKKTGESAEGRVGKIGPAVLTGEGVRNARQRRLSWLIALMILAVMAGCTWLIVHSGPQRQALDLYTAVVEGPRNRYGERILAIQERAWLVSLPPANVGVPPMIAMDGARISKPRSIKFATLKPLFDALKNLVPLDQAPVWLPANRVQEALADWRPDTKVDEFIAALVKHEKRVVDYREWQSKLQATGLSKEDSEVIDLLLRGRTKRGGGNEIAARLLAGDLPEAIELANFSGNHGQLLVDHGGQRYQPRDVKYQGVMLRFVGKEWPQEWKVLTISTAVNE